MKSFKHKLIVCALSAVCLLTGTLAMAFEDQLECDNFPGVDFKKVSCQTTPMEVEKGTTVTATGRVSYPGNSRYTMTIELYEKGKGKGKGKRVATMKGDGSLQLFHKMTSKAMIYTKYTATFTQRDTANGITGGIDLY